MRGEFTHVQFSAHAIQALIDHYQFERVLDVGSGAGVHADVFAQHGKSVTTVDYGRSIHFAHSKQANSIVGDFNTIVLPARFDCVWCSHVLEHQLNPHGFLRKVHAALEDTGILAITVPPAKDQIVGGHVSIWNAGLLLYHLVLAGFDCRDARILEYGYNLSIIIEKKTINVLDRLSYDSGDIRVIREYLPAALPFTPIEHDDPFDGRIEQLNWQF